MSEQTLYLFFAIFDDEKAAQPVAEAIQRATREEKVTIDGLASVHRDTHGHVHLHEIGDITGSQGAVRGGVAGALVGLVFPPSILASAVVGAGISSLVAKLHDSGFKTGDLHALGEELDEGQSAVVFLGESSVEGDLSDELKDARTVKKEPVDASLPDHVNKSEEDSN